MMVKDKNGNELIDVIKISEDDISSYSPVTHSLLIVKIGKEYLLGRNHFRKSWEIFGGCIEPSEKPRECIIREANEELGLEECSCTFIGLLKYAKNQGNYNQNRCIEYGGLYGITLPESMLKTIINHRKDRREIEKLSFYSHIKDKENISEIAEKLLEYWQY